MAKNAKKPLRKSTKISIGIIISVIVGDILFIWLYYMTAITQYWKDFIMFQIFVTIAITNYLALFLIPYTYRENEKYLKNTKKAVNIMAIVFNELGRRNIGDEMIARKIVNVFQFFEKNEEEFEAFTKCVIEPITNRIQDMSEEERILMYHNIGIGINYYLDDLESFASLSDEQIVELMKRRKRKSLRNQKNKGA